jgi:hypothetical protein
MHTVVYTLLGNHHQYYLYYYREESLHSRPIVLLAYGRCTVTYYMMVRECVMATSGFQRVCCQPQHRVV